MLRILNKANNPKKYLSQTNQAIQNCLANGVNPHIDFQVGIPEENGESERINERAWVWERIQVCAQLQKRKG